MSNNIREVEEEAIRYAFSHGGEQSVTIVKNVDDTGRDAESFGTVCQSYKLDSSRDTIVIDRRVCDELSELYAYNQFVEVGFFLSGYRDERGRVFIKEMNRNGENIC